MDVYAVNPKTGETRVLIRLAPSAMNDHKALQKELDALTPKLTCNLATGKPIEFLAPVTVLTHGVDCTRQAYQTLKREHLN